MYNINDLYFGTIETLEHLDAKYDVASFGKGFETGIFILNNKKILEKALKQEFLF